VADCAFAIGYFDGSQQAKVWLSHQRILWQCITSFLKVKLSIFGVMGAILWGRRKKDTEQSSYRQAKEEES